MVRVCPVCGKKFSYTHKSQKYCSEWCRRNAKDSRDKRSYNNISGGGYTALAAAIVITSLQDYARLSKAFYKGKHSPEEKRIIKSRMQAIEQWWASPWCSVLCMSELEPWELAKMLKAQARRTKAELCYV